MVIAYLRVSTMEQTIEQQQKAINEYAATHNLVIDKIYSDEGISAYSKTFEAREGLLEILNLAEQGLISDLLLFESSRLSRRYGESVSLIERLTMKGVRIHSIVDNGVINQNDIDSLMNAFRSYMNQQSSKLTSERIKAKLAHLKEQGLYIGGSVTWGFKVVDRKVVPDEELRPLIEQFFTDYINHGTSYVMEHYGLNRVTINKRIKNEDYIQIVGSDLWNQANKVRTSRVCRKDYTSRTNRSNALFEGLLYHCCGKKIYISYQTNGMYYRCYDCTSNTRKTYTGPRLERLIESEIARVFDNLSYEKLEEQYLLKIEKLKLVLELEQTSIDTEIESIEKTITNLKKKLTHFLCEDGSDSIVKHIGDLITENEKQIDSFLANKAEISARYYSLNDKIDAQLNNINNLLNAKEIYNNASIESKKTILQLIIDKIIVNEDDIQIHLNI